MMPSISVADLQQRLETPPADFVVLDCRDPLELQLASLDGTLNIPMHEIPGRLDELDRDLTYAVMCHHGVRSAHVVRFLAQQGFRSLLNVTGGIDAYARRVDPSVPLY